MGMYPNIMQPIPFMKHKSKYPPGAAQEKQTVVPEKNEAIEGNKEENKEENKVVVDPENQMQEEPKQE